MITAEELIADAKAEGDGTINALTLNLVLRSALKELLRSFSYDMARDSGAANCARMLAVCIADLEINNERQH